MSAVKEQCHLLDHARLAEAEALIRLLVRRNAVWEKSSGGFMGYRVKARAEAFLAGGKKE